MLMGKLYVYLVSKANNNQEKCQHKIEGNPDCQSFCGFFFSSYKQSNVKIQTYINVWKVVFLWAEPRIPQAAMQSDLYDLPPFQK